MENAGITFAADCFIGASNAFERWFCEHKVPLLTGFAWQGILTEIIISVSIFLMTTLFVVVLIRKKKKQIAKRF